jgi:hypothetical protein
MAEGDKMADYVTYPIDAVLDLKIEAFSFHDANFPSSIPFFSF